MGADVFPEKREYKQQYKIVQANMRKNSKANGQKHLCRRDCSPKKEKQNRQKKKEHRQYVAMNNRKIPLSVVSCMLRTGFILMPDGPGKCEAEDGTEKPFYQNICIHSSPLSRRLRSSAISSFVRPLLHSAVANVDRLPLQSLLKNRLPCSAR